MLRLLKNELTDVGKILPVTVKKGHEDTPESPGAETEAEYSPTKSSDEVAGANGLPTITINDIEDKDEEKGDSLPNMTSRKKKLVQVRSLLNCKENCCLPDCSLRTKTTGRENCNCVSTSQHCYFCFSHCCDICAENKDNLETGKRKCKDGECSSKVTDDEGDDETKINLSKADKPKSKIVSRRCGHCKECKSNCEAENRPAVNWCEVCRKKKQEGKLDKSRTACKMRKACPWKGKLEPPLSVHDDTNPSDEDARNEKKRKPEESPPGKFSCQKPKEDVENEQWKVTGAIPKA